jgi:trehalose-phosphatase
VKILNPEKNLTEFFDHLEKSANRALLLDYDGTLAPFSKERDRAFPYTGVVDLLQGIIQNGNTRLVLVTGRRVDDLIPLIGLKKLPEIWGSHGGERLSADGGYQKAPICDEAFTGLALVADWMAAMGWNSQIERKPLSVALHWRSLRPEKIKEIQSQAFEHLPALIKGTDLEVLKFDGGVELRPKGMTKAKAVETILAEVRSEAIAYLGDDFTDEEAFAALRGRGLGVLVRDELRKTGADLWLRPPDELLYFLRWWEGVTSYASED